MRFGVVCDVDGKTYFDDGATVEYGGMSYIFYVRDIKDRLLKQIRIISNVDDPEQYFFYKSEIAQDGTYTVSRGFEPHIYHKLVNELQLLESVLGIVGNIKRVYWNKATFEYYPETEAEFRRINIMPAFFFMHEMPVDYAAEVTIADLTKFIRHTDALKPLAVPMSFFREAKVEYISGRYINSFFNSYFIIEGLFGEGQWRKNVIVEKLTKSPVFSGFVQGFIEEVGENADPAEGMTKEQLLNDLKLIGQTLTIEGLVRLIVETRGKLHHFSINSTQAQGTPFNHLDYKRVAVISLQLAGDSLTHYVEQELNSQ